MLICRAIAYGRWFGQDRSGYVVLLPAPKKKLGVKVMKALISALALMSFVAAATIPVYSAQAQTTTTATPKAKKSTAKKSTAKKASKKKTSKKKAAPAAKPM